MHKLIIFGLFIALATFAPVILAENKHTTTAHLADTTTTTTTTTTTIETTTLEPTTTTAPDTTQTTTLTTTTAEPTTTTSITTTTPEPTTTTTPETTTKTDTTTPVTTPTTTTTTKSAPTTTTAPANIIFDFRFPKNESEKACLKVKFSLAFNISYLAKNENSTFNSSKLINLDSLNSYDGACTNTYNSLEVNFFGNWTLSLNYTLKDSEYDLETIVLNYYIDEHFENAVTNNDKQEAYGLNLNEFKANKGNSYKCTSETVVNLNNGASLLFKNYQGQPFATDSKSKDFDTAIECAADTTGTNKLVPIIVGSALAVLVILVLIAYIIGRRKHRPGYQQV